jgi:hypothetical protein
MTETKRIDLDDCAFFDADERALVADSLRVVEARDAREATLLWASLSRLAQTADVIAQSPPIASSLPARGARGAFSSESLVELLCRVPEYDLDLHVPTKAVLGQAFLVAKINFFKALGYALDAVSAPRAAVDAELGQSIYSKLAEEVLTSILADPEGRAEVKRASARALFRIWEERLSVEIDDFAPFLESVWKARERLRPVLGTMRGTHELLGLLRDAPDARVLDYFSEDLPDEELQAFEEFLFALSHEEIERLRAHLIEQRVSVVSVDDASRILGLQDRTWASATDAHAFYSSYKRRRLRAVYRQLTGAEGPKRTAEEYAMAAFLLRER